MPRRTTSRTLARRIWSFGPSVTASRTRWRSTPIRASPSSRAWAGTCRSMRALPASGRKTGASANRERLVLRAVAALGKARRPPGALIEIENLRHVDRVRIALGQAGQIPVGLNERQHAAELSARMIDVAALGVRRDDDQRNAESQTEFVDLVRRDMIIEAAEVVPGDE